MESGSETVASSLTDAVSRILAYRIPAGQPAILHLYKTPERRIAEQRKQYHEAKAKLAVKHELRLKGYCPDTDAELEKKLRSTALKGGDFHSVVKLFNEVTQAQGKQKQDEVGERFKRKMKRLEGSLSEGRKIVKYEGVVTPRWEALRDTINH